MLPTKGISRSRLHGARQVAEVKTLGSAESKPESRIEYLPATRRGGGEDRRSDEAEDHDRGAEPVDDRVVKVKYPGLGRDQEVEPERENL